MKKIPASIAALAVVMPLSGCQSFLSAFDLGTHSRAAQPVFGEADLEEGRRLLAEGHVGNAIPALQRAALNRETAPAAANALGVAYARLGRGDLAERYFRAAITLAPEDAKFAANLARFYDSELGQDVRTLHAQREEARKAYAEFAKTEAAVTPEIPATQERLVTSGGEQRKITLDSGQASTRVATGSAPAAAGAEKIRVSVGAAETSQPAPRVRVSVNGEPMRKARASRPAEVRVGSAQSYPMRVRIGKEATAAGPSTPSYPMRVSLRSTAKVER